MLTSLRTAADNAWTKIFSQVFTVESENQLREMFAATECLERRDFTMLHRVVLGLVSKDLRAELEASTSGISRAYRCILTPHQIPHNSNSTQQQRGHPR